MYNDDPFSCMTTVLLLSLILTFQLVGTPPVVGGAQATVSWSTDGLFSVMFPTGAAWGVTDLHVGQTTDKCTNVNSESHKCHSHLCFGQ